MSVLDEALAFASLIQDGDISPELLQELKDTAMLQEAVGGHYELEELTKGKLEDRGKIKLSPIKHSGGTNLPQTIDALLMAVDAERNGPLVEQRGPTPYSQELRMAGERILAPAGASQLAKVGLRAGAVEQLSPEERLERALDRIGELDRGFNPNTGALYEGVGLDGGHKKPHSKHGGQSADRENMMFENKYENRVKGNREGEDMVKSMRNSIIKRLRNDSLTPYELANRYQVGEGEGNVDEQTIVNGKRLVADDSLDNEVQFAGKKGQMVGYTDRNQGKVIKIDTDGGDVHLDSSMKKRRYR